WFGQGTGTPKWTYGDLGSVKCVSAVRAWVYSGYVPQTMDVQVSNDGATWTTVKPSWIVNAAEQWVETTFAETQARYVRLYITSCTSPYCNLREYEVKTRGGSSGSTTTSITSSTTTSTSSTTTTLPCTDSDGGNYNIKGFTRGPGYPSGVWDSCASSNTLLEGYCSGGNAVQMSYVCPGSGSTCTDGACILQSTTTTTLSGGCSGTPAYQITDTDYCSDQYGSGYTCDQVSNGNTYDYWFGQATGTPKWTYGDFGATKCVSAVRAWIFSADVPQTMDVQVSNDGATWTTIKSGWTVSASEQWVETTFAETQARYVRLYMTSCSRPYCNLREYEAKSRNSV
ncbi:MAG: discoidin domain-containing protein, partial [Candidatus Altiarchaeota archaeon]